MMKKGLVLSGGSAWGLANIGVVEVLEREGIRFDCIAGSSMGAIIAGCYALGVPVGVFESIALKLSLLDIARFTKHPLQDNRLHSGILRQKLSEILTPLLGDSQIGDCRIPFVCVAGKVKKPVEWKRILLPDFTEYFFSSIEPHVFPPETPMIAALLATSAIPVVFAPVRIGPDEFVDLIHFGAIPARRLREKYSPDIVIGTDTNPRYGVLRRFLPSPWREFLARGAAELMSDRQACDLVMTPHMPYPVFRFDKAGAFIAAGRSAAEKALPKIVSLVRKE